MSSGSSIEVNLDVGGLELILVVKIKDIGDKVAVTNLSNSAKTLIHS